MLQTKSERNPSVLLGITNQGIRIYHMTKQTAEESFSLKFEFPWNKVGRLFFAVRTNLNFTILHCLAILFVVGMRYLLAKHNLSRRSMPQLRKNANKLRADQAIIKPKPFSPSPNP